MVERAWSKSVVSCNGRSCCSRDEWVGGDGAPRKDPGRLDPLEAAVGLDRADAILTRELPLW